MAVLNPRKAFALVAVLALTMTACGPLPDPATQIVEVAADQPTWQSQPVGTGPGESILVNEGDAVVLSLSGSIVYKTELGGLRKLEADGWATDAECERCPMENRAVGALLCRIGADGAILTVTPDAPAFTAYRDGALQFMINDRHEAYGDNTGSLRVAVTVVRR